MKEMRHLLLEATYNDNKFQLHVNTFLLSLFAVSRHETNSIPELCTLPLPGISIYEYEMTP